VITIVFNGQSTLKKTIQSIEAQTYDNIEYIVIDGGSTDGTIELIRENEHLIDKWVSESDKGISDAFNKGIALATGDIIGLLNSGDTFYDDSIERIANLFDKFPETEIVYGNLFLDFGDASLNHVRFAAEDVDSRSFKCRFPDLNHPTVFVRRRLYEKIGNFDVSLRFAMDYDWLRRAHRFGARFRKIEGSPVAALEFDGASTSNASKTIEEVYRISLKFNDNKFVSAFYNLVYRKLRCGFRSYLLSCFWGRSFLSKLVAMVKRVES
jgi:glycosyltransferase involved in cell wall biosynthesis